MVDFQLSIASEIPFVDGIALQEHVSFDACTNPWLVSIPAHAPAGYPTTAIPTDITENVKNPRQYYKRVLRSFSLSKRKSSSENHNTGGSLSSAKKIKRTLLLGRLSKRSMELTRLSSTSSSIGSVCLDPVDSNNTCFLTTNASVLRRTSELDPLVAPPVEAQGVTTDSAEANEKQTTQTNKGFVAVLQSEGSAELVTLALDAPYLQESVVTIQTDTRPTTNPTFEDIDLGSCKDEQGPQSTSQEHNMDHHLKRLPLTGSNHGFSDTGSTLTSDRQWKDSPNWFLRRKKDPVPQETTVQPVGEAFREWGPRRFLHSFRPGWRSTSKQAPSTVSAETTDSVQFDGAASVELAPGEKIPRVCFSPANALARRHTTEHSVKWTRRSLKPFQSMRNVVRRAQMPHTLSTGFFSPVKDEFKYHNLNASTKKPSFFVWKRKEAPMVTANVMDSLSPCLSSFVEAADKNGREECPSDPIQRWDVWDMISLHQLRALYGAVQAGLAATASEKSVWLEALYRLLHSAGNRLDPEDPSRAAALHGQAVQTCLNVLQQATSSVYPEALDVAETQTTDTLPYDSDYTQPHLTYICLLLLQELCLSPVGITLFSELNGPCIVVQRLRTMKHLSSVDTSVDLQRELQPDIHLFPILETECLKASYRLLFSTCVPGNDCGEAWIQAGIVDFPKLILSHWLPEQSSSFNAHVDLVHIGLALGVLRVLGSRWGLDKETLHTFASLALQHLRMSSKDAWITENSLAVLAICQVRTSPTLTEELTDRSDIPVWEFVVDRCIQLEQDVHVVYQGLSTLKEACAADPLRVIPRLNATKLREFISSVLQEKAEPYLERVLPILGSLNQMLEVPPSVDSIVSILRATAQKPLLSLSSSLDFCDVDEDTTDHHLTAADDANREYDRITSNRLEQEIIVTEERTVSATLLTTHAEPFCPEVQTALECYFSEFPSTVDELSRNISQSKKENNTSLKIARTLQCSSTAEALETNMGVRDGVKLGFAESIEHSMLPPLQSLEQPTRHSNPGTPTSSHEAGLCDLLLHNTQQSCRKKETKRRLRRHRKRRNKYAEICV